ncbi:MAG: hypothetical protein A3D87_06495 [Omnitrophica WOR_2 bacterium RIFCSPHIGHO2_02_FULL_50_17]|nr:MAG: hypothetical protein A3D87_06495 [Omnitrophica WOR_2 bacterium RIFCSPHIGHO2_02_FULL_50_17]
MKIEVKKVDAVRRELKFEIPKDRVSQKFNEVYEELGKVVKVKGFRPGKVPRAILESHTAKLAQEEVIKKLVPEVYHEAIEREKMTPLDLPEILDVNFKAGMITFTAKLDVKPDVKIEDYKGIKVTKKSSGVTEEEVSKTLEFLRKGQGDGKEIALDDVFARGLGFPTLEEFKKSLTRQMEIEKERQNRLDVENQIVGHLLKKAKLVTPPSLVKKQFERRLHEVIHRLQQQGLSDEEIKKREEGIHKELQEAVERDVKVYLIVDKIGELEHMEAKEGENLPAKVMEFLLKEAKWEEAK